MNEETVSFLNNINFENTAKVYETISILFEKNQVLKKAIKEGVIATCETCEDFGICPHSYREYDYKDEVEKLKNQQKEFIEYLNWMFNYYQKEEQKYRTLSNRAMKVAFESVLEKYKEIIGGDNK